MGLSPSSSTLNTISNFLAKKLNLNTNNKADSSFTYGAIICGKFG